MLSKIAYKLTLIGDAETTAVLSCDGPVEIRRPWSTAPAVLRRRQLPCQIPRLFRMSRKHLEIRCEQHPLLDGQQQQQQFSVCDLSVNGTLLNGERLAPHQKHVLRDGDELGLVWKENPLHPGAAPFVSLAVKFSVVKTPVAAAAVAPYPPAAAAAAASAAANVSAAMAASVRDAAGGFIPIYSSVSITGGPTPPCCSAPSCAGSQHHQQPQHAVPHRLPAGVPAAGDMSTATSLSRDDTHTVKAILGKGALNISFPNLPHPSTLPGGVGGNLKRSLEDCSGGGGALLFGADDLRLPTTAAANKRPRLDALDATAAAAAAAAGFHAPSAVVLSSSGEVPYPYGTPLLQHPASAVPVAAYGVDSAATSGSESVSPEMPSPAARRRQQRPPPAAAAGRRLDSSYGDDEDYDDEYEASPPVQRRDGSSSRKADRVLKSWSAQDEQRLLQMVVSGRGDPKAWKDIAVEFPGRTPDAVRNKFKKIVEADPKLAALFRERAKETAAAATRANAAVVVAATAAASPAAATAAAVVAAKSPAPALSSTAAAAAAPSAASADSSVVAALPEPSSPPRSPVPLTPPGSASTSGPPRRIWTTDPAAQLVVPPSPAAAPSRDTSRPWAFGPGPHSAPLPTGVLGPEVA